MRMPPSGSPGGPSGPTTAPFRGPSSTNFTRLISNASRIFVRVTSATASPSAAAPFDRSHWEAAVADYEREEAAYSAVSAQYEAACREYDRQYPDRSEEFKAYGLSTLDRSDTRERLIFRTELYVAATEYHGRENLSAEEYGTIKEKAVRVVDDFLAWRAKGKEVSARIYDPAEQAHDAAVDKLVIARERLLNTPAPDAGAVQYKLELLAAVMTESRDQEAEHVTGIRDDVRRLLAS
jgi:hypothetical protein